MKIYLKNEREEYNQRRDRVCVELGITKNQYNWFRREGEKLHMIYEDDCNGVFNDEETADSHYQPIYDRVDAKVKELGLHIYYQTDPRGATIYLDTKKIPENNYTQAYCIY